MKRPRAYVSQHFLKDYQRFRIFREVEPHFICIFAWMTAYVNINSTIVNCSPFWPLNHNNWNCADINSTSFCDCCDSTNRQDDNEEQNVGGLQMMWFFHSSNIWYVRSSITIFDSTSFVMKHILKVAYLHFHDVNIFE